MGSFQLRATFAEQLEAVFTDRFEHAEARLTRRRVALEEAVVDKVPEAVEVGPDDRLCGVERAAARENRELGQVSALVG